MILALQHSSIRSCKFSDRNGEYPHSNVYVMTPSDHMSTGLPWPFLSMTSGAAYPKEPAMVVKTSSLVSSILAIPKSARTRSESGSRFRYRRFSGLRSMQISLAPRMCGFTNLCEPRSCHASSQQPRVPVESSEKHPSP